MTGPAGLNAGLFNFTFPTETGPDYLVEYKFDLAETNWQIFATYSGTGLPVTVNNSDPVSARKFYRIRVQ